MHGVPLPIFALTPFTLLDFPQRIACIVWFSGCNMRCAYCHNPRLLREKGRIDTEQVLRFLEKRRGLLDGVVLSGGEASLYPDLPVFIRQIRALGYAVKLDTNGSRPTMLRALLGEGLLDYVALDYKAPAYKFAPLTGGKVRFDALDQSLKLLIAQNATPFEIRTTVHTDVMDEGDINAIIADLEQRGYRGALHIQNFRDDDGRETLGNLPPQTRVLNAEILKTPVHFSLAFRNFS